MASPSFRPPVQRRRALAFSLARAATQLGSQPSRPGCRDQPLGNREGEFAEEPITGADLETARRFLTAASEYIGAITKTATTTGGRHSKPWPAARPADVISIDGSSPRCGPGDATGSVALPVLLPARGHPDDQRRTTRPPGKYGSAEVVPFEEVGLARHGRRRPGQKFPPFPAAEPQPRTGFFVLPDYWRLERYRWVGDDESRLRRHRRSALVSFVGTPTLYYPAQARADG